MKVPHLFHRLDGDIGHSGSNLSSVPAVKSRCQATETEMAGEVGHLRSDRVPQAGRGFTF